MKATKGDNSTSDTKSKEGTQSYVPQKTDYVKCKHDFDTNGYCKLYGCPFAYEEIQV